MQGRGCQSLKLFYGTFYCSPNLHGKLILYVFLFVTSFPLIYFRQRPTWLAPALGRVSHMSDGNNNRVSWSCVWNSLRFSIRWKTISTWIGFLPYQTKVDSIVTFRWELSNWFPGHWQGYFVIVYIVTHWGRSKKIGKFYELVLNRWPPPPLGKFRTLVVNFCRKSRFKAKKTNFGKLRNPWPPFYNGLIPKFYLRQFDLGSLGQIALGTVLPLAWLPDQIFLGKFGSTGLV